MSFKLLNSKELEAGRQASAPVKTSSAEIRGLSFRSSEFRKYPRISAVYRVNPRTSAACKSIPWKSIPWSSPFFLSPAFYLRFALNQCLYPNSIPCLLNILPRYGRAWLRRSGDAIYFQARSKVRAESLCRLRSRCIPSFLPPSSLPVRPLFP